MGWVYRLPEIKELVGGYRIVEKLGRGSYGHVYKAEQAGRCYAVKILQVGEAPFGSRTEDRRAHGSSPRCE